MKQITILKDTLINVNYSLMSVNSKELSKTLKDNLSSKSINYNDFNNDYINKFRDTPNIIDLPIEVYEYQNFFLLEKENGELILLDGFRRLLWNETVDHEILVRVYKESDMDTESILKLLVSLNHTKFFGGIGNFYDRGFALALFVIFNVNITNIYKSFNGYLTVEKPIYEYSISYLKNENKHLSTLDKVTNISFIEDMKFLEDIQKSNVIEMDEIFGSFISSIRKNNPDIKMDSKDFITKVKNNTVLLKQIESFKKSKDSRGNDIGNKMFEMFSNILLNKTGEKSFAERTAEIKEALNLIKKDKSWFNYTGNKKIGFEDSYWTHDKNGKGYNAKGIKILINEYKEKHGVYPKVKVFVYPSEKELLKEGIYDDFEIIGFKPKTHLIYTWNILQVKRGDIILSGNFHVDNTYNLSRIEGGSMGNKKYNDIVLFIKDLKFDNETI